MVKRLGAPIIRTAIKRSMKILGRQFVLAETIERALKAAKDDENRGYRFSYDMLGEAAYTMADADRYLSSYEHAIKMVGQAAGQGLVETKPGVSVKLSALHPRYEFSQSDRVKSELLDRLVGLCELAAKHDVGLTVDAEEADRLEMSLDLMEVAAEQKSLGDWRGLGMAVQAYQRRALPVIDWAVDLAKRNRRRLMIRLVKGAYWDTEIKRAQVDGLSDFPVFTRKAHTDISYLACAGRLLEAGQLIYPCFATHNANTLGMLIEMIGNRKDVEFQRLHGMGEALYQKIVEDGDLGLSCRVYAPVGGHEELLAYLVRRLLENGANTSFVNRIAQDETPIEQIVRDPIAIARERKFTPHEGIRQPEDLFAPDRLNSKGLDLTDPDIADELLASMRAHSEQDLATPIVGGEGLSGETVPIVSPADASVLVGYVVETTAEQAQNALEIAAKAASNWQKTSVQQRADILRRAADMMEEISPRLIHLISHEAGRTLKDAHLEIREAVDFLRYYANQAETLMSSKIMPGPTGELNEWRLSGRGPFLCISPWNFPAAIFTGQIAAALSVGCPVLAKPAEQTPLVACEIIKLLHEAGIPKDVLHFLPGDGPKIGNALFADDRLTGVAFTGGFDTARIINTALAKRQGPIIPLIAETGGLNAMIVDSTALPEQVTRDVLASAFQSAGQRCSALRILCLQEDIAERQLDQIKGAMLELRLGVPWELSTDIGPVIDQEAKERIHTYLEAIPNEQRLLELDLSDTLKRQGRFVSPSLIELNKLDDLQEEVFGPVLHVVRWKADELDGFIDQINALGYGLTLGVHSRSQSRIQKITSRAHVGNIYVNRNQIGAVVETQPFGGEGRSGTGPKAGGPLYLTRFCHERTISTDTTATGGNMEILKL